MVIDQKVINKNNIMKKTILILVVIAGVVGITLYSKNNKQVIDNGGIVAEDTAPIVTEESETEEESEPVSEGPGSYVDYDDVDIATLDGKIVLDFYAPWCPSCRTLERDIEANLDDIPSDLTIVKVSYDFERALKKQYGVTRQHTLVQVDTLGNKITLWTGGNTLESIISKVQ